MTGFNYELFARIAIVLLGMAVFGVLYARSSQRHEDLRIDREVST